MAENEDAEGAPIDPLTLPVNERTFWLVSRLQHVEDLLNGVADIQKMLIAVLAADEVQRDALREALTSQALMHRPGTLRTVPIWSALGQLDDAGPSGREPDEWPPG
jgi:hypothetical protein